jgi:signal transduction histidine kinase
MAPRAQVELLRIISEALNNVRKHADATIVRITAEVNDGELFIAITDNGRGFDESEAFDRGMGLQGMHERARLIGGSLLVRSEFSGGTTIEVRAPVVTSGVGSVSATSERTAMAPDELEEELEAELPASLAGGPAAETADVKPTGMQT